MKFNSVEFLMVFLPLVFAVFHLSPPRARLFVIVLASSIFYGYSGTTPLMFMLACIVWGWATAHLLRHSSGVLGTILSISFPLAVLFLFKYLNFTLASVGASNEMRDAFLFFLGVTLPPGISFYTFQIVSYSLDARDGTVDRETSLLKIAAYISFFAQLIAGPIVRYAEMRGQLERISTQRWIEVDYARALKFLSIGLFGKVIVSDVFYVLNYNYNGANLELDVNSLDVLFLIFSYSFRIYFDFWSYSLMAIGLGLFFGIKLPVNFKEPYQAASPRDFWRRWHVTLSYWLKDYVYIRLGGNAAYVRNICIVFLLCGLWHGAGWNFVVWGGYHAVLVLAYHFVRPVWDKAPMFLQVGTTFFLVSLGWPLFFADMVEYAAMIEKLFSFQTAATGIYGTRHWLLLGIVALWVFASKERVWLYNEKPLAVFDWPAVHAVMLFAGLMFVSFSQTFIYFRF